MAQPPTYDVTAYSYGGVVRRNFRSPVYTEPWPYGERVGVTFGPGEIIEDFLEFRLSEDGRFLAARISLGWVNIWCLNTGRRGRRPRGIFYIDVLATERPAAAG